MYGIYPVSLHTCTYMYMYMQALDGFLMVTQLDGTIIFLSESIHKHLGLFQVCVCLCICALDDMYTICVAIEQCSKTLIFCLVWVRVICTLHGGHTISCKSYGSIMCSYVVASVHSQSFKPCLLIVDCQRGSQWLYGSNPFCLTFSRSLSVWAHWCQHVWTYPGWGPWWCTAKNLWSWW